MRNIKKEKMKLFKYDKGKFQVYAKDKEEADKIYERSFGHSFDKKYKKEIKEDESRNKNRFP